MYGEPACLYSRMKARFKTINLSLYHQLKRVTGFYWFVSARNTINLILICQSYSLTVSHTQIATSQKTWCDGDGYYHFWLILNKHLATFPKRLLHLKTRKIRLTNIFLLLALSLMASWNFLLSSTSSTSHTGSRAGQTAKTREKTFVSNNPGFVHLELHSARCRNVAVNLRCNILIIRDDWLDWNSLNTLAVVWHCGIILC